MRLCIPENARYSCFACGRCCRTWISLSAAEAERLRALPSPFTREATVQTYQSRRGEGARIRPRPDGSCPYLREDSLCHLHAEQGPETKPLACRLFPASFVRLPDGLAASLKSSCPAVALGAGAPLADRRGELQKLAGEIERVTEMDRAGDPAPFDARRRLPLEDLETLHGHFLRLLARPQPGFLSRIAGAVEFLSLVGASSLTAASRFRYWQGLEDGVPARFSRPLVPPSPPGGLERSLFRQTAFALASLSSPEALRRGLAGRAASRASAAARGLAHTLGAGSLSWAFAQGVPTAPFVQKILRDAGPGGPADEDAAGPLLRFLAGQLEGHAYYTGRFTPRTVQEGLISLFHLVPFAIRFAREVAGAGPLRAVETAQGVVQVADALSTPAAGARLSRGISGWLFQNPETWPKLAAWATGTPEGEPIVRMNEA
jgi:Fe-S-cluster containining protein